MQERRTLGRMGSEFSSGRKAEMSTYLELSKRRKSPPKQMLVSAKVKDRESVLSLSNVLPQANVAS